MHNQLSNAIHILNFIMTQSEYKILLCNTISVMVYRYIQWIIDGKMENKQYTFSTSTEIRIACKYLNRLVLFGALRTCDTVR